MRYLIFPLLVLGFLFTSLMPAPAGAISPGEIARIDSATAVINEVMLIPDSGIPANLLNKAYGIAVFPGVLKAAFGIGARWGQGVIVARNPDGSWTQPSFLNLAGGSFGFQIGASSTDIILVFMTRNSVDALGRGDLTLGGTASVAVGPVGRNAEASTDVTLRAEILSYSKSRGLFAGVALDGAVVSVDTNVNYDLYGVADPIRSAALKTPDVAQRFSCVVARYTGGSPKGVCT